MLSDTSTSVNPMSARKLGHSTSMPLPFISVARAMMPKWRMGFSHVMGCSQAGMASTGVSDPESTDSGGLMKNAVIMDCCADLVNVATNVQVGGASGGE